MNKTTAITLAALIIGIIIGYNVPKNNDGGTFSKNEGYPEEHRMMDDDEEFGMGGHMMNMNVSSEKEFIEGMIPHHQEAVDTAKEVIARGGTTPEIKKLVENIVVAQESEIADMKQWYKSWYGADYVDSGDYSHMMRELENLSGEEIDKAFLEDMIMHHMGAIMMAKSVQPYIEHNEVTKLTQAIMTTQSQEIMQMKLMLQNL